MLQREVEFTGDETCENCGEQLDTTEGDTTWKESPRLILLCNQCEGSYNADLNQDVIIMESN